MIAGGKNTPDKVTSRPVVAVALGLANVQAAQSGERALGNGEAAPAFSSAFFRRIAADADRLASQLWSARSDPNVTPNSRQTVSSPENAADKHARCIGRSAELRAALLGNQKGWLGGEFGSKPAYFDRIKGNVKSIETIPGSTRVRIVLDQVRAYAFSNETGIRQETDDETFLRLDAGSHDLFFDGADPEGRRIKGAVVDIGPDGTIALTFDSEEQLRSMVNIGGDFYYEICK